MPRATRFPVPGVASIESSSPIFDGSAEFRAESNQTHGNQESIFFAIIGLGITRKNRFFTINNRF